MGIKTLVIDDAVLYRKILSDAIAQVNELELVGTAPTGAIGLKKIPALGVELVLLDVHMPEMDGVDTLKHIKSEFPAIKVIMISGVSDRSATETITALELGAIDFIAKPMGSDFEGNMVTIVAALRGALQFIPHSRNALGHHIRNDNPTHSLLHQPTSLHLHENHLSSIDTKSERKATPFKKSILPPQKDNITTPHFFSILAIGVSTGGPEALTRLIPTFPQNFPLPVVMVQHMPPGFTKSLADSLDKKSAIHVCEAKSGDVLQAGTIYLAPGGHHMVLRQENHNVVVQLNDDPPENSCRPAVDVLFRSVAQIYGGKGILSVILTGMGSDGAIGVQHLKEKGCYSITQSEETCVVYGMPRAVDELGLSDASLPLESIVPHIMQKLRRN